MGELVTAIEITRGDVKMKQKRVLVVDLYESCVGCPCRRYSEETDVSKCEALFSVIPDDVRVLENCPLKVLPARKPGENEFEQGWNAAIDQIDLHQ